MRRTAILVGFFGFGVVGLSGPDRAASWIDAALNAPAKAPRARVVVVAAAADAPSVGSEPLEPETEPALGVRRVASRAGGSSGRARATTAEAGASNDGVATDDAPARGLADADIASAIAAEQAANRAAGDPATWQVLPPALAADDAEASESKSATWGEWIDGVVYGADGPSRLASIASEAWVLAEPRWRARKLGYLRAGSVVKRKAKSAGNNGCKGGWYAVEPKGFVCVGKMATTDVDHPVVVASSRRPGTESLPYEYVMSRLPTPPLYARLPSAAEQARVEQDLAGHSRRVELLRKNTDYVEPPPPEEIPAFVQASLAAGAALPALGDRGARSRDQLSLGNARIRSGFALLHQFDHEGRRFGLTTDLTIVPIDRTRFIRPSSFHGIELGESQGKAATLPVAFIRSKHAVRQDVGEDGALVAGDPLAFREAVPLTGASKPGPGGTQLESKEGFFIADRNVVRVDPPAQMPAWASEGRKWIDVSILKQTLTAYEGRTPVYVTLVSTGRDGIGDPKETHSTVQGAFLIHTKHVTITMDGDDAGDEFDLREVPWVQYFTEGYALHAAYWHDEFGTPRSHGCVNLSPIDAAWLFAWTTPEVPDGWHAALTLKKGTLVHIHP